MELLLETYKKPLAHVKSEATGHSKMTINLTTYQELESLEENLKEPGRPKMFIDIHKGILKINTRAIRGELQDTKIRLFLDEQSRAGL